MTIITRSYKTEARLPADVLEALDVLDAHMLAIYEHDLGPVGTLTEEIEVHPQPLAKTSFDGQPYTEVATMWARCDSDQWVGYAIIINADGTVAVDG